MSEGERPLGLSRHPTEDWDAHETSTAKEGESKEKSKLDAHDREALGEWINSSSDEEKETEN